MNENGKRTYSGWYPKAAASGIADGFRGGFGLSAHGGVHFSWCGSTAPTGDGRGGWTDLCDHPDFIGATSAVRLDGRTQSKTKIDEINGDYLITLCRFRYGLGAK